MKVLVTGASGFIGSYLAKHLSYYDVHAPTSKELNLTDRQAVVEYCFGHKFDTIVHCAAVGRDTPRKIDNQIVSDNLSMFVNLAHCRESFGRLINFSSGADYSIDLSLDCVSENELEHYVPVHSYGLSKNITARLAKNLDKCYNVRLFSVIDKSESENRLLKRFISHVKEGKQFILKDDRYVDFFSLPDIFKVIESYIEEEPYNTDMNLVYLKKYKVSDILYMYCNIHGIDSDAYMVESQSLINYIGNGELLCKEKLRLDGIIKTLENYL
jgi:nucleoside-diphosphate-sugar epimerase